MERFVGLEARALKMPKRHTVDLIVDMARRKDESRKKKKKTSDWQKPPRNTPSLRSQGTDPRRRNNQEAAII
jgi:hypothetical protein